MKLFLLFLTVFVAAEAQANNQKVQPPASQALAPNTQQQALSAISLAVDAREAWYQFVEQVEAAIDALPAGPMKTAVEDAWNLFHVFWTYADDAAESHIDLAIEAYDEGDYAEASSLADTAILQLGLLDFHYEVFADACQDAGWTPPSPPSGSGGGPGGGPGA